MVDRLELVTTSKLPQESLRDIVRAYAAHVPVRELHEKTGVSQNTLYWHYGLIRERLALLGYFGVHPSVTRSDQDIYKHIKSDLMSRRGLRDENFGWHVAEVSFWQDRPDPKLVLKHIHQIIRMTGPLDYDPVMSEAGREVVEAYIAFARTEIIASILARKPDRSEFDEEQLSNARTASEDLYRTYLAARKRLVRGLHAVPRRRPRK
jgi:hypothetical protein